MFCVTFSSLGIIQNIFFFFLSFIHIYSCYRIPNLLTLKLHSYADADADSNAVADTDADANAETKEG